VISRLRRAVLAAIARPRPSLPAIAPRRRRRAGTRNDVERRLDAARERLKAAIPPPAD
jgi:hypothetical protein